MQCVHGQLPFGKGGIGEDCCLATVVHSAVQNKTISELECTLRWRTSQYLDSGNIGNRI
jgi:hypothetical protein